MNPGSERISRPGSEQCYIDIVWREELRDLIVGQIRSQLCARLT